MSESSTIGLTKEARPRETPAPETKKRGSAAANADTGVSGQLAGQDPSVQDYTSDEGTTKSPAKPRRSTVNFHINTSKPLQLSARSYAPARPPTPYPSGRFPKEFECDDLLHALLSLIGVLSIKVLLVLLFRRY